mgnify:CR=1 FL=1
MRKTYLFPVLLVGLAACDSVLDVEPTTAVSEDRAIVDEASARAALAGVYDALTDDLYYGGDFLYFTDLSSDDVRHSGTFAAFGDADRHQLRADNGTVDGIWTAIYRAIGRANSLIQRLPDIEMAASTRNQMLGEAYFIRALSYHNLVKLWGGVPLRLEPPADPEEASQIARSTVEQVYEQILDDLATAESLLSNESQPRSASLGAVNALRSRVYLYLGQWQNVVDAADEVLELGYALAPKFSDLFDPDGASTDEDIFRLSFTPQEFNYIGYYYLSRRNGGRYEVAPEDALIDLFDPADERFAWSIGWDEAGNVNATKYPTPAGAEDVHVIRLAEVILNRAEALARLGGNANLQEAIAAYNLIRVRAGLPAHTFGVDVTNQAEVLAEVRLQRRLELAFEGDRFADMVRAGEAGAIPETQRLYPIPQSEIDVAPNLTQNPGY